MTDEVRFTNLDAPLFEGAGASKGDLVDYLDSCADRLVAALSDRPLSVLRSTRGQRPFMQKNLPTSTPPWVQRVPIWAETSQRTVSYALCNDRRTLLWFANQRAIEYHPTLVRLGEDRTPPGHVTHLVLDLDPPVGAPFAEAVNAARMVREALNDAGLDGAVKTSGAKGLHVFVPVDSSISLEDAAAATRAIARRAELRDPVRTTTEYLKSDRGDRVFIDATRSGWGTVVAVYSPRARPGLPVSCPVGWDELDDIDPATLTIHSAPQRWGDSDPWAVAMPEPLTVDQDLIAEGHTIPIPRVAAMHEGRRRARARDTTD